ncbi:MAG: BlaI/MecI/CopY family transcriptional regulator, partial [Caldicoprobacter sp.]|uniref:BlaI/MecI/CopY family transcriptional regulator n=1 Tax=Caldicoprobacter sp. TaxID=2004500 RepID=UPI0039C394D0
KMRNIPQISDAEWKVMKVIWAKSRCTASEVIQELSSCTRWKPKTVKTLLSRLVKKGVLGYEERDRAYVYYPLIDEEECIKKESRSFLERVYNGSLSRMLITFIKEAKLTDREIDELKRILDEKKE